jgi:hypothetical protein
MSEQPENLDNPAAPDADADDPNRLVAEDGPLQHAREAEEAREEPQGYGQDDAVADGQDDQAEQTDNSGEPGDDAPQDPGAVAVEDNELDDAGQ